MRWTIRGIPTDTADAVRDVAFETGSTLGDVVMLCVRYGLPEARRHLEAKYAEESELDALLREIRQTTSEIREAFSSEAHERPESTCNADHPNPRGHD